MTSITKQLNDILNTETKFRRAQIERAWFDVNINSYDEITTLPLALREKLKVIPWMSFKTHTALVSKVDNTRKYLLELNDGNYIEMVLMGRKNRKENVGDDALDRYTICISSQAGCPMQCVFCATGKAGFKRHLTAEEIVDQYRIAQRILAKEGNRVSNIVMMGQGEPLLNYDNVKRALNILLKNTDLGNTKITMSTAGVVHSMEQMLKDDDFPPVRFALSLHSAIEETRKKIMPSHKKGFLDFLVIWANAYHKKLGTRTHFIGLEYIMLAGINDDVKHLKALITLCKKMPHLRVNLIPYNYTGDPESAAAANALEEKMGSNYRIFTRTPHEQIEHWHEEIMKAGFTSTIRYSQGQDIAAACGQLRNRVT
jgi:23S rRNA (adenine2503-C2)-methyltransferase